jgi:hypothetical protein
MVGPRGLSTKSVEMGLGAVRRNPAQLEPTPFSQAHPPDFFSQGYGQSGLNGPAPYKSTLPSAQFGLAQLISAPLGLRVNSAPPAQLG